MKKFGRFLALVALLIAGTTVVLFTWLRLTAGAAADLPPLKNGDIVFQYSGSSQSLPILLASRSAYTHMGIVDLRRGGNPMVIEASSPVRSTPLEEWIGRGVAGRITVMRMSALSTAQAEAILNAADKYLGLPYDIFFLNEKDAIYCSELIHLAFGDCAGISLGQVQRVSDLDLDYAPVRKLIEARWQKYPLCRDGKKDSFNACYQTILQQTLVTPASIAHDEKLELIFTNFGVAAE